MKTRTAILPEITGQAYFSVEPDWGIVGLEEIQVFAKDCIKQSIFYTVSRSFVIVWLLTFQLG